MTVRSLALVVASVLALVVTSVLIGCATTPPSSVDGAWTSGRMSVQVDATVARPSQNLSAAFELRGQGDRGELHLLSPLGTMLVVARWAPGSATLRTPEGERAFDSLDELARQALGETLPLAALPDWLAARPWPAIGHRQHPEGFEQLGWTVHTARKAEGLITARRSAAPAVVLRVKLDSPSP